MHGFQSEGLVSFLKRVKMLGFGLWRMDNLLIHWQFVLALTNHPI